MLGNDVILAVGAMAGDGREEASGVKKKKNMVKHGKTYRALEHFTYLTIIVLELVIVFEGLRCLCMLPK